MNKLIVFIRSLLLGVGLLLACTAQANTQAQIDQVVKRLSDIAVVQGGFNQQKKLQGLAYPLNAQGQFIFWRGQGLYIANEKPFFSAMTITGGDIINWQKNGTGSIASEQSGLIQREINKTLLAFLSADIALIQQRFIADWIFEQEQWQLTLTPRLDLIKKNMRNAVMNGDQFLQKLVVTAANGDETTIEFHSQIESAAPSAAQCQWFYLQPQQPCASFASAP
ncbi:LolA family protein [Cellvibrio sp. OA-2007]|uniref:LolA family protein n=1 Tax=Cellvibrio sp. OA-2007 TaxID=529823 RepID=UPI000784A84F|nr:outer membrane lipoprotein carrier protein LolA [Cellvibrio sp. OA-2007]